MIREYIRYKNVAGIVLPIIKKQDLQTDELVVVFKKPSTASDTKIKWFG